jgi:multiple sugar transport system substrate-binding protein
MSRTRLQLGLISLVAAVALAACGGPGGGGGGGGGAQGTGSFTFATGKDTSGWTQKLVGDWNKQHPDQKVSLVELPEAADAQRSLFVTNLQAKSDRYDVMGLDVIWTAEFAKSGWLLELDQSQFPLDKELKPAVDTAMFEGKLWAAPFGTNGGLLYYRKDILDKAGKQPPKTFDELKALCPLAKGFKDGTMPKPAVTYKEEEGRRAFMAGQLLFHRNWPYVYAKANESDPANKVKGKFGVVPLPGFSGEGSSSLGGLNLAVSAFSKKQKSAVDFLKYASTREAQKGATILSASPVVWADLYDDPELIKKFPYLPVLKKGLLAAKPRPVTPYYQEVTSAIQEDAYAALQGQKAPDQAINDLTKKLNDIAAQTS